MKYLSALFLVLLFAVFASAQKGKVSDCRPASETDVPLGGNIDVTQTAGKVKQIKGTTSSADGKYFEDVVVEVFKVSDEERREIENNASRIPDRKKRIIACVTGEKGKFGFRNLPKGMYILRVGTRTRAIEYFNYVFVVVEIDPKSGKNENIEVGLIVAT